MHVYRLVTEIFATDLSGEGARLFGGRWNHKGVPCVYAVSSRAMAVLEFAVNIDAHNMPKHLQLVTIDVDEKSMTIIKNSELPKEWASYPATSATKDFGSDLLSEKKYSIIQLPSSVIPQESNYLLNPLHTAAQKWKIISVEKYPFDKRIKS